MKYSFIVPIYNCKTYLFDCVNSICASGINDYEILLIDDGSTDGSSEACDILAQNHQEVRVFHQMNTGASAARNRGIDEALGENILFIDSDDGVDSTALCRVLSDANCNGVDLVIYGMAFDYYYRGRCYRQDKLLYEHSGIMNKSEWGNRFVEMFIHNSLSSLCNKVFKREIINKCGYLNTDLFLYEDFEFVLRYLQNCNEIWNVPQAIYHYRQSEDEGNAGKRLARLPAVTEIAEALERAMIDLRKTNTALTQYHTDAVMQMLYLSLAGGKIGVSNLIEIRDVCRDFRQWAADRELPLQERAFQNNLRKERVLRLYLSRKKSAARHWLAVRVKSFLYSIKSDWGM